MAQTYYIYFRKGRVKSTIPLVVSTTTVNVDLYDRTNYRDDLTGGRGSDAVSYDFAEKNPYGTAITVPPSGSPIVAPGIYSFLDLLGVAQYVSVSDVIAHIAPRNELKKYTKIIFWSAAAGTGDELASFWADEVYYWGTGDIVAI